MPAPTDPFGARDTLQTTSGPVLFYRLQRLETLGLGRMDRLPFSIRILLEGALRQCDGLKVTEDDARAIAGWKGKPAEREVPFLPARVLLQDFTGVPAVADLAAMRSALRRAGRDPSAINPARPVDLVIDHSVQVDVAGSPEAPSVNLRLEFARNRERYAFLRWAQRAFDNLRVVPPAGGIVHQINLEHLATVVGTHTADGGVVAFPDSLVGADSHTTMVNGLGVLGWGVGGIEAEANMLGQPFYILLPEVVGVRLTGDLREGTTATDAVLTVTEILRRHGVVGKFVEFFGEGVGRLALPDRATIANMAPEYGATVGFFPVDAETLAYLRFTGRPVEQAALVEAYCKEQGLFRTDGMPDPEFSEVVELDLGSVEPSLSGPGRPHDRVPLSGVAGEFRKALSAPLARRGFGLSEEDAGRTVRVRIGAAGEAPGERPPVGLGAETGRGRTEEAVTEIGHGAIVIAAITSCTNTSNPSVMIAAGLLAKKAVELGLRVPPHVKTSLAPGSKVVTEYLHEAGLLEPLEHLGFHVVGYGCTTCIGNSGPLPGPVAEAIGEGDLVAAAVLSGNRNFEGRIHPLVKANYLASPPLVVAYALAGSIGVDLNIEPLGRTPEGAPVHLREIWPARAEIERVVRSALRPEQFSEQYSRASDGSAGWQSLDVPSGLVYEWDPDSTYIQEPPFFLGMPAGPEPARGIAGARALLVLGDSITTDHISPAGSIDPQSPAGLYLGERGIRRADLNTYGARRGSHDVMARGTFANIRLKNLMRPGVEGPTTVHLPGREVMSVYDAAMRYVQEGVPLLVIAGREYGCGSSRDWAAKGPHLLGVRAVIVESFERIHRSNLVGMGILPLQFLDGQGREALGLDGFESYDIEGIGDDLRPRQRVHVRATRDDGSAVEFEAVVRIDAPVEIEYYRHGGILNMMLRGLIGGGA